MVGVLEDKETLQLSLGVAEWLDTAPADGGAGGIVGSSRSDFGSPNWFNIACGYECRGILCFA